MNSGGRKGETNYELSGINEVAEEPQAKAVRGPLSFIGLGELARASGHPQSLHRPCMARRAIRGRPRTEPLCGRPGRVPSGSAGSGARNLGG
ncbi:MAG: hypothetical protein JWM63_2230 [Gammaproteobacteria bacterium]|jgi:hypothetical protein|nr:hypothetical protein [Gammaproteobacteria bacterium]